MNPIGVGASRSVNAFGHSWHFAVRLNILNVRKNCMSVASVCHHIKLKQIGHVRQAYCKDENVSHTHTRRERERERGRERQRQRESATESGLLAGLMSNCDIYIAVYSYKNIDMFFISYICIVGVLSQPRLILELSVEGRPGPPAATPLLYKWGKKACK